MIFVRLRVLGLRGFGSCDVSDKLGKKSLADPVRRISTFQLCMFDLNAVHCSVSIFSSLDNVGDDTFMSVTS